MWWMAQPVRFSESGSTETVTLSRYSGDPKEWNQYVDNHPAGSIYHRWGWLEVVSTSFGFETLGLVARRGDCVTGILPLTVITGPLFGTYLTSSAFADVGGVIADDEPTARALIAAAKDLSRRVKARHVEFRNVFPISADGLVNTKKKVLSVLKLPDSLEDLWTSFGGKVRNQIRKSQKAGFTVQWGGAELLKPFYEVYLRNMRDLGSPALSMSFFRNVIGCLGKGATVLILYKGGLSVSGAVGLTYRQTMEVPWASSLREYFHLCPNNLLYWELLKRCVEHQMSYFSFGRSTVDSSTYRFKKQWGAKAVILNYQFLQTSRRPLPDLSSSNRKYNLLISFWKKLPLCVAGRLGPRIARGLA